MLIDDFLPEYDVVERHSIMVSAPAAVTYAAIRTADLAAAIPVRVLLAIRALPGAVGRGIRGLSNLRGRAAERITLKNFEKTGFSILAEDPPRELLIGLVGAFWKPSGGICVTDPEQFRGRPLPGTARAAWNFSIEEVDQTRVRLATETRVQPADSRSAKFFRAYWLIVRPGSGLIRRYMLKAIRREAETVAGRRTPDAGHQSPNAGHQTPDAGHQTTDGG